MHCMTCNEKHSWSARNPKCDWCGESCKTVRTHLGAGFGHSRYICSDCIDKINDGNTDFCGKWKGYLIDRFGRSVSLLCAEARDELARTTVVVMPYGGGEMCDDDDEAIKVIEKLEGESLFGYVIGEWYGRNVVAVYGDGGRLFLVVPKGITDNALCAYADDVRTVYAHSNGELCGKSWCEICFG